jgi:hypothetical protein
MYLFVFSNGLVRQVEDNITIVDALAMKNNLLSVYSFKDGQFYQVVIEDNQFVYKEVEQAKIVQGESGRLHHI